MDGSSSDTGDSREMGGLVTADDGSSSDTGDSRGMGVVVIELTVEGWDE